MTGSAHRPVSGLPVRPPRLRPHRLPEKSVTDRGVLDALLDSELVAHVGVTMEHGPVVLPTLVARDGDRLLLHGSTGSGWMRLAAAGAPLCVTVTALDGIVVARSAFESSVHYRCAVVFGHAEVLAGDQRLHALDVITDRLLPGRTAEVRTSNVKELAATMVLALPLTQWSLKVSDGWPEDSPDDVAGPAWAGVVDLRRTWDEPRPAPDLRPDVPVPPSVLALGPGTVTPPV